MKNVLKLPAVMFFSVVTASLFLAFSIRDVSANDVSTYGTSSYDASTRDTSTRTSQPSNSPPNRIPLHYYEVDGVGWWKPADPNNGCTYSPPPPWTPHYSGNIKCTIGSNTKKYRMECADDSGNGNFCDLVRRVN